jgi:hypothetical protein
MADGMAEWQKEWQNGRMAEMATYVLFMVHTDDTDTNTNTTLIFYSIETSWGGFSKSLLLISHSDLNVSRTSCQYSVMSTWENK